MDGLVTGVGLHICLKITQVWLMLNIFYKNAACSCEQYEIQMAADEVMTVSSQQHALAHAIHCLSHRQRARAGFYGNGPKKLPLKP